MKISKILVTTDFSDLSHQAFPAAASLARRLGAQLELVHVMEPMPPSIFFSGEGVQAYDPERDYVMRIENLLERTAREEKSFQGLWVKTRLLEGGFLHERLVRFQEQEGIDLSVMSTHGRSGLARLFMGSFAEKAVRLSVSPVLAYRPGPRPGATGEFAPRTILVPYDFSTNARTVLDAVRFLANTFDAQLIFQHVLEPLADLSFLSGTKAVEAAQVASALPEVQKELVGFLRREFPGGDHFKADASYGNPFLEILRLAEKRKVDLIVMATHGWTGLKHMLLGSVTEKVVRHAPCSVLTVRPTAMQLEAS
jgi:nucleotide-binding universal stress UspA family protein